MFGLEGIAAYSVLAYIAFFVAIFVIMSGYYFVVQTFFAYFWMSTLDPVKVRLRIVYYEAVYLTSVIVVIGLVSELF